MDAVVLGLYVLAAAAAVAYGASRRMLARVALLALAALGVLWALAFVATATGWRDADGWVDCGDHCGALQHATGSTLAAGVLLGPLLIVIAVVAALRSRRPAPD